MISGVTTFWGTTGVFSVKNENAQTRAVIMEKYKKPELTIPGGTRVYGSQTFSGTTTFSIWGSTNYFTKREASVDTRIIITEKYIPTKIYGLQRFS